jgi:hypothetical protein
LHTNPRFSDIELAFREPEQEEYNSDNSEPWWYQPGPVTVASSISGDTSSQATDEVRISGRSSPRIRYQPGTAVFDDDGDGSEGDQRRSQRMRRPTFLGGMEFDFESQTDDSQSDENWEGSNPRLRDRIDTLRRMKKWDGDLSGEMNKYRGQNRD